MRSFFFSILFLAISFISLGQTQKDTLVAWQHYQKADSLLKAKEYDKSIVLLKKALPSYEKAKNWERIASIYNKIAENQTKVKKLEKSLQYAKKALDICETHIIEDHPEKANAYDNIGAYYERKNTYKKVLSYYQKALTIREKIFPVNHLDIGTSYSNLAVYYTKTDKYQSAITYFEKALAIYLETLDPEHSKIETVYSYLGRVYTVLEQYNTSISFYKKALAIGVQNLEANHLKIGKTYHNMGIVYFRASQLDNALEYYEKALSIFKKENYKATATYLNIGALFHEKGEFDKALPYYKKSLDLSKEVYGENHTATATIYKNMGIVTNDFEKALFYFKKAIEIYKNTIGENHSKTAHAYHNLGIIYLDKKEYDTALAYYQKSLKIKQKIFSKHHSSIARSYINIGNIYKEKKSYDKALENYHKSLTILENSSKHYNTTFPLVYYKIGNIYYRQENYTKALSYLDKALVYRTKKNIPKASLDTFDPKHYINPDESLFNRFFWKAYILQERYERDKKTEDLNQCIALYKNLDALVDYLRLSYQNYNDKIQLAERAKEMYLNAIEAELTAHHLFNTPAPLEKAFYYAEKSKSNILKDLLLDNSAKDFMKIPGEITTLEASLKLKLASYQSKLISAQSKDSEDIATVQAYENQILQINRRQDSLIQILETTYPKYYQLKHQNNVISVNSIQEKLGKKTTLVEFFTSDSTTYVFTISKNDIDVKELSTPELKENISNVHEAIVAKNNTTYMPIAYDLYEQLIAPIQDHLSGNKLIIIPDGSLWHLNFDLLLTQEETTKNPKNLPYLLRDYAISYANSATLLFNDSYPANDQQRKQEGCLAFSFSDSANVMKSKNISLATLRNTGEDLPGTRKEIKAIANIMDGQYYYGSEATEQNFKKNTNSYKILHLALHGEVDHEKPENSKLYFTKSKDSIEDDLLYAHELLAIDIPSELTVLSACNTGTGKIAKGEGIMSLGNAFQYAGTKSLLLSSWAISDKTTPELMQYFYTNLNDGMDKPGALQQAKLQYLRTADLHKTAPFYWGGFYLIGDTNPIDIKNTTYWYWVLLIAFVLFLLIYGFRRRKHTK